MAVTPVALLASTVTTGGTPIQVTPGAINGGFITNPSDPADQGLSVAEPLYISPVSPTPGSAPGAANGVTFALYPGATWTFTPGQTTPVFVNASSDGHKFSGIYF